MRSAIGFHEPPTVTAEDFLKWRKSAGFTQTRAAMILGTTDRQVRRFEAGAIVVPQSIAIGMQAIQLARALVMLEQEVDLLATERAKETTQAVKDALAVYSRFAGWPAPGSNYSAARGD